MTDEDKLDRETGAILAMLIQRAHDVTSGGDVHRELKKRILAQARVEITRDRSLSDVTETLFDTAFDLGRSYELWQQSLPENNDE